LAKELLCGKAVSHIPRARVFVCVALVIQLAKHMRRIVLPSVACLAAQNFPYYLLNGKIF
jgi:hypothetical protein